MTQNSPPPVPMLNNLGRSQAERKDVENLKQFLYLLWVRLGGGENSFDDVSNHNDLSSSISSIRGQIYSLSNEVEDFRQLGMADRTNFYDDSDIFNMLEHFDSQLSEIKTQIGSLGKNIDDLQQEVQV